VHAPTTPAYFAGGDPATTLGRAVGLDGGFTAVSDGGHWKSFGDHAADGVVTELVAAMTTDWQYAETAMVGEDKNIALSDRQTTVGLANSLEEMLSSVVVDAQGDGE
jgi:hypothetical protein